MKIEILRLNHRISRDKRVSSHVGLTARAFGASKLYYSGQKDSNIEESIKKIVDKFGGPFEIKYCDNEIKLIKEKKKEDFVIVHLTVYGKDFKEFKNKLDNNILIIVGGEKVEPEFYELSDYNLSVGNQPHSEIAALGIFLYDLFGCKTKFNDAKVEIIGMERGKLIKS